MNIAVMTFRLRASWVNNLKEKRIKRLTEIRQQLREGGS